MAHMQDFKGPPTSFHKQEHAITGLTGVQEAFFLGHLLEQYSD